MHKKQQKPWQALSEIFRLKLSGNFALCIMAAFCTMLASFATFTFFFFGDAKPKFVVSLCHSICSCSFQEHTINCPQIPSNISPIYVNKEFFFVTVQRQCPPFDEIMRFFPMAEQITCLDVPSFFLSTTRAPLTQRPHTTAMTISNATENKNNSLTPGFPNTEQSVPGADTAKIAAFLGGGVLVASVLFLSAIRFLRKRTSSSSPPVRFKSISYTDRFLLDPTDRTHVLTLLDPSLEYNGGSTQDESGHLPSPHERPTATASKAELWQMREEFIGTVRTIVRPWSLIGPSLDEVFDSGFS